MKSLVIIITGLFGLFLFDDNLLRLRRTETPVSSFVAIELKDQKEKTKRVQRKYKNQKYKKRKLFLNKRYKYSDAKPKDQRFSNQKTLRRMYRNG